MANKHVLLIEDEPNIAEAIRFILMRAGWTVSIRVDGGEALSAIDALSPDAVILDLMLPVCSGLEILTMVRARPEYAQLPVLMLTARGQARDREAAERAGVSAFLPKPFSNAEVLEVLNQIVSCAESSGDA